MSSNEQLRPRVHDRDNATDTEANEHMQSRFEPAANEEISNDKDSLLTQQVPPPPYLCREPTLRPICNTMYASCPLRCRFRRPDSLKLTELMLCQAEAAGLHHAPAWHRARKRTAIFTNFAIVMERTDEQILPAVYRFIGASFNASPSQLGVLTLSRALTQALASPFGGLLGVPQIHCRAATYIQDLSAGFYLYAIILSVPLNTPYTF